jgi:hypothetical protein
MNMWNLPNTDVRPLQAATFGGRNSALVWRLGAATHRGLRRVWGLTKSEAEDLLDWLESQGCPGRLSFGEGGLSYTVEYEEGRG